MRTQVAFLSEVIERSRALESGLARPDPIRGAARERLAARGLPGGSKLETWKYTAIGDFYIDALAADRPHDGSRSVVPLRSDDATTAGVRITRLASGVPNPLPIGTNAAVDLDRYPLALVNTALVEDVLLIDVAPNTTVAQPIELLGRTSGVTPRCSRVQLRLGENSRCTVLERDGGDLATNHIIEIDLAAGAELDHERIEERGSAPCWSLISVEVGASATYRGSLYAFGGAPRRGDVHVKLRGAGAGADIQGALAASGSDALDLQIVLEHFGRATRSRQKFHGVASDRGTFTFNGRIAIHPAADGADAQLSSRNLLLSANARINTKPELEINNRDVRCSHGATVGQLDADQLFYLRSRGLDAAMARTLLMRAFIDQCLTSRARERNVEALFTEVMR